MQADFDRFSKNENISVKIFVVDKRLSAILKDIKQSIWNY